MDRPLKRSNVCSRAAPMAEWLAALPRTAPGLQDRIQCLTQVSEYGLGGESGVDPPVPIPNTEVKRPSADDTAWATGWENRPVPGPYFCLTAPSSGIMSQTDAGWSSGSSSGS